MAWQENPERQAINQHLWRMHNRAVRRGTDVLPKLAFHEELHQQGSEMTPPHIHPDISDPARWELIDEKNQEGDTGAVQQMDHQL